MQDNSQLITNNLKNNLRPCPQCGHPIVGMPGGYDAYCSICGFKDPCCSD